MGRRGLGRRGLLVLAGLIVASLATALGTAFGSQLNSGAQYFADPGEANDISVSQPAGPGTFSMSDSGVATITTDPSYGCTVVGNQATCPVSDALWFELGDLNDRVAAGPGVTDRFYVVGGPGDDTVIAGVHSSDFFIGGSATDFPAIYGETGTGDDVFEGGAGNQDVAYPGDGDDVVDGGAGDDNGLFGDLGDDVVRGGTGNDYVDFAGADVGLGLQEGADLLDGGDGNDLLYGVEDHVNAADTVLCGSGRDFAEIGLQDSVAADCERVRQTYSCPAPAPGNCVVSALITTAGPVGAAAASGAAAAARRPVVLSDVRQTSIKPGDSRSVALKLLRKRVNRVVRGGKTVKVNGVGRRRVEGRSIRSQKLPFKLRQR